MASQTIQITIRNVPEEVRDELAARAARRHQSMQEFLLAELEALSRRPSLEAWLEGVNERKALSPRRVSSNLILQGRDADRRGIDPG